MKKTIQGSTHFQVGWTSLHHVEKWQVEWIYDPRIALSIMNHQQSEKPLSCEKKRQFFSGEENRVPSNRGSQPVVESVNYLTDGSDVESPGRIRNESRRIAWTMKRLRHPFLTLLDVKWRLCERSWKNHWSPLERKLTWSAKKIVKN